MPITTLLRKKRSWKGTNHSKKRLRFWGSPKASTSEKSASRKQGFCIHFSWSRGVRQCASRLAGISVGMSSSVAGQEGGDTWVKGAIQSQSPHQVMRWNNYMETCHLFVRYTDFVVSPRRIAPLECMYVCCSTVLVCQSVFHWLTPLRQVK